MNLDNIVDSSVYFFIAFPDGTSAAAAVSVIHRLHNILDQFIYVFLLSNRLLHRGLEVRVLCIRKLSPGIPSGLTPLPGLLGEWQRDFSLLHLISDKSKIMVLSRLAIRLWSCKCSTEHSTWCVCTWKLNLRGNLHKLILVKWLKNAFTSRMPVPVNLSSWTADIFLVVVLSAKLPLWVKSNNPW